MRSLYLVFAVLMLLAACDANGSAQGSGDGNYGHGNVTLGVPF